jgi:hypothetical protein
MQDKYHERKVTGRPLAKTRVQQHRFASYPLMLERAGLAEGARLFAQNPARVLSIKKAKSPRAMATWRTRG